MVDKQEAAADSSALAEAAEAAAEEQANPDKQLRARRTSAQAFWDPRTWIVEFPLVTLAASLFVASVAIMLATGVIPAFSSLSAIAGGEVKPPAVSLVIQLIIVVATTWGFSQTAHLLSRLSVEKSVAEHVTATSSEELREIRGGRQPIDLDDVPKLWPKNTESSLITLRLLDVVHNDAIDSYFGSREAMMQHYRDELDGDHGRLAALQKAVLHAGILGTFIGLFFAMPSLTLTEESDLRPSTFAPLFESLGVCFSTSITGLVASLCLGFAASRAEHHQDVFYRRLDQMTAATLAVMRNALNRTHVARSLADVTQALKSHAGLMFSQNQRLEEQATLLSDGFSRMRKVTEEMQKFSDDFRQLRAQLIDETQQAFAAMVKGHDTSAAALETLADEATRKFADESGRLQQERRQIETSVEAFREEQGKCVAQNTEHQHALATAYQQQQAELARTLEDIRQFHMGQVIVDAIREGNESITEVMDKGLGQVTEEIRGATPAREIHSAVEWALAKLRSSTPPPVQRDVRVRRKSFFSRIGWPWRRQTTRSDASPPETDPVHS